MKELSIEERAKRYNEAIKKAGERYNNEYTSTLERSTLAYVFPELKESEGEMIINLLKMVVEKWQNVGYADYVMDIPKSDILAWLEKQGERANFRNKIQIGDRVTRNEDGVLVNLSQLNRVAKKDEKQGENNMGISEATKQELEDNLNNALEKETPESWNEFLDGQGEQKPNTVLDIEIPFGAKDSELYSWEYTIPEGMEATIVDNKIVVKKKELKKIEQKKDMHDKLTAFESSLKHIIEEAIECGDTHNLKADADMLLRLAQKPAEWSGEDEDILNTIINHFYVDIECTDKDDTVRWLRTLKERYAWKPSEIQLETLKELSHDVPTKRGIIEELLKQLKQL